MQKIQNIYAFCDRWCERCAFGARCEAFAADKSIRNPENLEAGDAANRLFWQKVESRLPEVLQYVSRKALAEEADLNDFPGISTRPKFDLFQRKAVNNMVLKAGRLYEDKVDDFLDEAAESGRIVMDELQPGSVFKMNDEQLPENEKQEADDLISVVMRYQLQLYLKLSRAYYSQGIENEEGKTSGQQPLESDGTAKVCLMLINRSLAAWFGLLKFFPEKAGAVDEILFLLVRMKNRLQQEFPKAESFKRPGFDD